MEKEIENIDKMLDIKQKELLKNEEKEKMLSDPEVAMNIIQTKTKLKERILNIQKDTTKQQEINNLQNKQLELYQKTGKSIHQNNIAELSKEMMYIHKKNSKLKQNLKQTNESIS